jgi:hypothetical protein
MTIADTPAPKEAITAALLVIGDKILSGRNKDQNIGYIAEYLTALGMHLVEVRVIGDEETAIVNAVEAQNVQITVVTFNLEVAIVWSIPLIDDLDNFDLTPIEPKAHRRFGCPLPHLLGQAQADPASALRICLAGRGGGVSGLPRFGNRLWVIRG